MLALSVPQLNNHGFQTNPAFQISNNAHVDDSTNDDR